MIAIIAAVAKNRAIGYNGRIPWDIPEDRKVFRELTTGHAIVMGRRTFDEIGHPLPKRMNYLLSSTEVVETENCHTIGSLKEAVDKEKDTDRTLYICGGESLYQEGMPFADKLCITEINKEIKGDTFFPEFSREDFLEMERKKLTGEGNASFVVYERLKKMSRIWEELGGCKGEKVLKTKKKQIRIRRPYQKEQEVYAPVIYQNCMRPEEITTYAMQVEKISETELKLHTRYEEAQICVRDCVGEVSDWEEKIHKVDCRHCENCGRCSW